MVKITPVLMAGGSGTRLWPVSRKSFPKQFAPLIGDETLFQASARRLSGPDFNDPVVMTNSDFRFIVAEQLEQAAIQPGRIMIEPAGRNTAPAIALAAARVPPDAVLLVCPSDHHIANPDAFRAAALAAADLAREDWLVSFGIAPERAETGYGYLRRGEDLPGGFRIAKFVEKPDREKAEAYLASGEYSWNGGIFAFRAGALLDELATHRPAMAQAVASAVEAGEARGARFYPDAATFGAIVGESIDYAVMENTGRAAMVPVDMGWSDIGNWAALHDALVDDPAAANARIDARGNAARGAVDLDEDCRNVLAISDGPRVSAVGLEDVCIIVSGDEVLVTTREGAQRVGKLPGASGQ